MDFETTKDIPYYTKIINIYFSQQCADEKKMFHVIFLI